jgi:murein DD-endopeptidase MepM/ murein hydrolase activator NlpD
MHNGIDWATPVGTPLVAVCNGQIVHAGLNSPFAAGPRR